MVRVPHPMLRKPTKVVRVHKTSYITGGFLVTTVPTLNPDAEKANEVEPKITEATDAEKAKEVEFLSSNITEGNFLFIHKTP